MPRNLEWQCRSRIPSLEPVHEDVQGAVVLTQPAVQYGSLIVQPSSLQLKQKLLSNGGRLRGGGGGDWEGVRLIRTSTVQYQAVLSLVWDKKFCNLLCVWYLYNSILTVIDLTNLLFVRINYNNGIFSEFLSIKWFWFDLISKLNKYMVANPAETH